MTESDDEGVWRRRLIERFRATGSVGFLRAARQLKRSGSESDTADEAEADTAGAFLEALQSLRHRRGGRPRHDDRPALGEMERLIYDGGYSEREAAAIVARSVDANSPAAAADRLRRKYRADRPLRESRRALARQLAAMDEASDATSRLAANVGRSLARADQARAAMIRGFIRRVGQNRRRG